MCPLCGNNSSSKYHTDVHRSYLQCTRCALVYVPESYHLSLDEERAEYELHRNSPDDAGYRRFLSRLAEPMMDRLAPCSNGLDFGCGPGPTLSVMLEEAGHTVALYDPFFAPDKSVLDFKYDFITMSEVAEHLRRPSNIWRQLHACLKPGGTLAVMTQMVKNVESFRKWQYTTDQTHICFYSPETFEWLAQTLNVDHIPIGRDVVLMTRPKQGGS